MRLLVLLAALAMAAPALAAEADAGYVQAVEFPYYLYPRWLWERELVWLKAIGIRTVAFSVPWNWHQTGPGEYDFSGRSNPRRDLLGWIRLLRRLEIRAWIRTMPPVKGWKNAGYPAGATADRRAAARWLEELGKVLAPQQERHGGPVALVEGSGLADMPAPPAPVVSVSAADPAALARSRRVMAQARGSLLWEDVEDALYPAGWHADDVPDFRRGAVSLNGDERPGIASLRRNAALLKNWAALMAGMRPRGGAVRPVSGKFPAGVTAAELAPAGAGPASAVSVINQSDGPFRGDLRVWDPAVRRHLQIPGVEVAADDALWLPLEVSLAGGGLCRDCSGFAASEHIVYATAELEAVEFENGILAMEFAAPSAGEVVLELARRPSGPFLAAGRPTKFDWDEKSMRARLPVPAGKGPGNRVRIGLAIEAPEQSAFFVEPKRLILGRKNLIATSYSSEKLAVRSRLRLPESFSAKAVMQSPTEIQYEIEVPAEAAHGDWANLAIEADGVLLGRARLQVFRPASVRLTDGLQLHFGSEEGLPVEPPLVPMEAKAGRNLDVVIRNNTLQIQNYVVEAASEGFRFFPPRAEISVGAVLERTLQLRIFPEEASAGLHEARLRIRGGADVDLPVRLLVIPRGQTVSYAADLDGDGTPEWVLENQRARAVFSPQDGGRWREFVWKDSNLNVLPEGGSLAGSGPVEVRAAGDALEMSGPGWKRTIRLAGSEARLEIEQSTPLPAETPRPHTASEIFFEVKRESPLRAVYTVMKK